MRRNLCLFLIGLSIILSYGQTVTAQVVRPFDLSATILPKASEGMLILTSVPDSNTTLGSGDQVIYTIKYRSQSSGSWPFVIKANWSKGHIDGSSNYEDTVDYKIDSATMTDNGVAPTIDLQNKTITWNLSSLQNSNSFHEVHFTLGVRSDVVADQKSVATITASGSLNGNDLTNETLPATVEVPSIMPSATPASPTISPSGTPTPSPTPTIANSTPTIVFQAIQLRQITNDGMTLLLKTTNETKYRISYGTLPTKLDGQSQSDEYADTRTVQLSNLKPDTDYYVRITVTDKNNLQTTSDLYTFKTSTSEPLPPISGSDIVISVDNVLVWAQSVIAGSSPPPIMTTALNPLTISIKLPPSKKITSIVAKLQNARVLGMTTFADEIPIQETRLEELSPGVFSGVLKTPQEEGQYQFIVQVTEADGNFSVQTLPQVLYVSEPLTVREENTDKSIEKAQIVLKQNGGEQVYTTDVNGEITGAIRSGTYSLTASATGYQTKTATINIGATDHYPVIYLKPIYNVGGIVDYYRSSFTDSSQKLVDGVGLFFLSQQTRAVSFLLIVLTGFFCGLMAVSVRLHTSISGIPLWTIDHLIGRYRHEKKRFVLYEGNNYHKRLPGAQVLIMDQKNRLIGSHKTDLIGKIDLPTNTFTKAAFPLTIFSYHRGYFSYPTSIDKNSLEMKTIDLFTTKESVEGTDLQAFVSWLFDIFIICASDLLLIGVVILSILIFAYQGLVVAMPYLVMSVLLFVFWLTYLHQIWTFERNDTYQKP